MKAYLMDTFHYNDWANQQTLQLIAQMPEPTEAIRLFSHLVTSQRKWMARLTGDPAEAQMTWFAPPYALEELAKHWHDSIAEWLTYLAQLPDDALQRTVQYVAGDGKAYASRVQDIALQLNYHSIHHRAQISLIARQQQLTPPFLDYIGFARLKVENIV